jgi:8-oxo-dGTP diphosphatase
MQLKKIGVRKKMTKYAEIIKSLSNTELNALFLNIKELWENGQFPAGEYPFHELLNKVKKEVTPTFTMHTLEKDILFEIALRSFPLIEYGMPEFAHSRVGVGAVILREDQILLILRGKAPQANMWSIPGGKVESFEPLANAIVREVKEELNLTVKIEGLLDTAETMDNFEHWISIIYEVSIVEGEPKSMEPDTVLDVKWFDLDNLPENIASFSIPAIKAIQNNKKVNRHPT